MTHAKVKRVDLRGQSLDPVELFAKYHIVGLRHTKTGYLRQVKHVTFGWMTPQAYYALQKSHDLTDRLDPLKVASIAVLAFLNKAVLDAGGQTFLNSLTTSRGTVDWQSVAIFLFEGPLFYTLTHVIFPPPPGKPEATPEWQKWAEALIAAILELELGPVLLSGLKLL